MTNPFEHFAAPIPAQLAEQNTIKSFVDNATNSFIYNLIQSPYKGLAQLVEHLPGNMHLPELRLVDTPTSKQVYSSDWAAQQIGGGFATIAHFALIGWLLKGKPANVTAQGLVKGAASVPIGRQACLGGLYGALAPVEEGRSFSNEKFRQITAGVLSFGAMEYVSSGIRAAGAGSIPIVSRLLRNETANSLVAGAAVGSLTADIDSIVNTGYMATEQQRLESAISFMLINGSMSGARRWAQHRQGNQVNAKFLTGESNPADVVSADVVSSKSKAGSPEAPDLLRLRATAAEKGQLPRLGVLDMANIAEPDLPARFLPVTELDPVLRRLYESSAKSIVRVDGGNFGTDKKSSGFIVGSDGTVACSFHGIGDMASGRVSSDISVTTFDGRVFRADLVGANPFRDIAVLKLRNAQDANLRPLEISKAPMQRNDRLVAFGYLFDSTGSHLHAADGFLESAQSWRSPSGQGHIHADMSIIAPGRHGMSGGPILDINGRVRSLSSYSIPDDLLKGPKPRQISSLLAAVSRDRPTKLQAHRLWVMAPDLSLFQ